MKEITNKFVLGLSAQVISQDRVHAGRRCVSFCGTALFYTSISKVMLYIVVITELLRIRG